MPAGANDRSWGCRRVAVALPERVTVAAADVPGTLDGGAVRGDITAAHDLRTGLFARLRDPRLRGCAIAEAASQHITKEVCRRG